MIDCATQIWSQLGLDVSLTINDSNKLLVSLSNQSSTNADIRPPRCSPSTCLEDIGMTFYFSACRRTRDVSRAQVAVSGSAIEHTLSSISPIDEDFERYYSPMSLPGGPKGVHGILTDGYTRWILGGSSVDNSPVSSQGSVSSNTYSTSSLEVLPPRPRYATQGVKLEILVRLMDSSLRRMISDCKPVRPGGVVLSSDAGCPKLAAIFPALFSPGYVKVKPVIELRDAADGLILGGFAAYWATSHDSTHCVSGVSPHQFQPLETKARAITEFITQRIFGSWLNRGLRPMWRHIYIFCRSAAMVSGAEQAD